MKELSLHILDIVQNSVKAGAQNISVTIWDEGARRTVTVTDDGCGMSPDFVAAVTDPFTTTRTTRSVGLGIPLFKLAAEQTGGRLEIESAQQGADGGPHGTRVCATFDTSHLDCVPLGDMASSIVTLLQGEPDRNFTFVWRTDAGEKRLSSEQMREILGGAVPLNAPEVLLWASEYWREPFEAQAGGA